MNEKFSSSTITSTQVRQLLRTAAKQLGGREEKVARMRSGTSLDRNQPLPQRGQEHPEARAELLALEIELKRKLAARSKPAPQQKAHEQVRTKEKDKIIRALRRLK